MKKLKQAVAMLVILIGTGMYWAPGFHWYTAVGVIFGPGLLGFLSHWWDFKD